MTCKRLSTDDLQNIVHPGHASIRFTESLLLKAVASLNQTTAVQRYSANRINHCSEFVHAAQFTSQLTFAVHAHAKVHALLIEEVSEGGQPIPYRNMH